MNVAARTLRVLKPMVHYRTITNELVKSASWGRDVHLQEDEECLGVYENPPEETIERVLITNLGLHIYRDKQWKFVAYTQIKSIETPSDKQGVNQLIVHLQNDQTAAIPISGGQGRFRDAFGFLRFLDRVVDDLRRSNLTPPSSQ